jgi:hypothetical protein
MKMDGFDMVWKFAWVLIVTPEGKRQHGGSRHWWEDNVKLDIK